MSECGIFDDEKFLKTLHNLDEGNPEDHVMESLKELTEEPCPISGGKHKKKIKGWTNCNKTQY